MISTFISLMVYNANLRVFLFLFLFNTILFGPWLVSNSSHLYTPNIYKSLAYPYQISNPGGTIFPADLAPALYHLPNLVLIKQFWIQRTPPFWSSNNGFGTPVLEAFETTPLSFFNIPYLLFDLDLQRVLFFTSQAEFFFSSFFCFLFASLCNFRPISSIFLAVGYSYSFWNIATVNLPEHRSSLLLPMLLWSVEIVRIYRSKGVPVLASSLAVLINSGHPEASLGVMMSVFFYSIARALCLPLSYSLRFFAFLSLSVVLAALSTSSLWFSFLSVWRNYSSHVNSEYFYAQPRDLIIVVKSLFLTMADPGHLPRMTGIGFGYSNLFTNYLVPFLFIMSLFGLKRSHFWPGVSLFLFPISCLVLLRPWGIWHSAPYSNSYYFFPSIVFGIVFLASSKLNNIISNAHQTGMGLGLVPDRRVNNRPISIYVTVMFCILLLLGNCFFNIDSSNILPDMISTFLFYIREFSNAQLMVPVLRGYDRYLLLILGFVCVVTIFINGPFTRILLLIFLFASSSISIWSLLEMHPYSSERIYTPESLPHPPESRLISTSLSSNMRPGNTSVLQSQRDARLTTSFHTCRYRIFVELVNSGRISSCEAITYRGNNLNLDRLNMELFRRVGISQVLIPSFVDVTGASGPISIYDPSDYSGSLIHLYNSSQQIQIIYNWQQCNDLGYNSVSQLLISGSLTTIDRNFGKLKGDQISYCRPFADNSPRSIASTYSVLEHRDGLLRLTFDAPQPARVVYRQSWNDNWSVSVDGGQPQSVEYADFLFMASPEIPPGIHFVEFKYSPKFWLWSYYISIITSIVTILSMLLIMSIKKMLIFPGVSVIILVSGYLALLTR